MADIPECDCGTVGIYGNFVGEGSPHLPKRIQPKCQLNPLRMRRFSAILACSVRTGALLIANPATGIPMMSLIGTMRHEDTHTQHIMK